MDWLFVIFVVAQNFIMKACYSQTTSSFLLYCLLSVLESTLTTSYIWSFPVLCFLLIEDKVKNFDLGGNFKASSDQEKDFYRRKLAHMSLKFL